MCLLFWGNSHLAIFSFAIVLAYLVSYEMCSYPQERKGTQKFSSTVELTGQCPFKATLGISIKSLKMCSIFIQPHLQKKCNVPGNGHEGERERSFCFRLLELHIFTCSQNKLLLGKSCTGACTATALLHLLPALLPSTTAGQRYQLHRHLPLPFLQLFCGGICFKKWNKCKIYTEGKSEKTLTVSDKWSLYYSKIFLKSSGRSLELLWLCQISMRAESQPCLSQLHQTVYLNYQSKSRRVLLKQLLEKTKERIRKIQTSF